jgi:Fur family transcriptional regulator, ferric uptake regulator
VTASKLASQAPLGHQAEEIKLSGLKVTLPRVKILEVFQNAGQRHLAAEDVHKLLLREGSDIGLATVYRALVQFTQAGLLTRQHFDDGRALFEINEGKHHDHMVCLRCGKVIEFYDAQIEDRQRELAAQHGFELQEHSLAMYGLCAEAACRSERS